jgi:hypothetical protein
MCWKNSFLSLVVVATFASISNARSSELDDLLSQDLWSKRDAYDAAQNLVVPMMDAYSRSDGKLVDEFRSFFSRYLSDDNRASLDRLTELQFNYFLAEFVRQEARDKNCADLEDRALKYLNSRTAYYLQAPAWLWSTPDFAGMFDRVNWKLAHNPTQPGYLRAIFDEELFAFSTAADIVIATKICGQQPADILLQATRLGQHVLLTEGQFQGNDWLFQPGVWRNHPDYAFAGNAVLAPGLERSPVDGIGMDSSHSIRFPLWIESLRCAAAPDSDERRRLDAVKTGLAATFFNRVYEKPSSAFPAVRLKNYMTGDNGIYRYGYQTSGKGGGYGPYGLSIAFNLGGWAVLGPAMVQPYRDQLASLPFSEPVRELYLQPIVTDKQAPRPRNPFFDPPHYLSEGLIKTQLNAAVNVAAEGQGCVDF